MSFTHPLGLQEAHQALEHGDLPCLVLVVMQGCPACEHMKGAIREVESQMTSGQGPPGSVVVVDSQIAQQSSHPALDGVLGYPTVKIIEGRGDSGTPVVGRSSADMLDALAMAASQASHTPTAPAVDQVLALEAEEEPSIALSGIPSSVAVKKKKKKTKKKKTKKKKKKKKKGGGTRRRGRGGRTRRRGGRRSRSRLRGGGVGGCGCA